MSQRYVIAVHLGAGPPCSTAKQVIYEQLCKSACKLALKVLRNNGNAVDAACEAVRVLEDSPYTNAGNGSNLTLCGRVECDASVMDGKTLRYGAVGALSQIQNPVLVAKALLEQQNKGLLSLGRIPPCMLVSEGARRWAVDRGFRTVTNDEMVTKKAQRTHQKYKQKVNDDTWTKKAKLQSVSDCRPSAAVGEQINCTLECSLDTIGAVCIDAMGNVASAVSSGGLILKQMGRIGQAAIYAAGCWAENACDSDKKLPNSSQADNVSVAVVTTGVGENLIRTMLSKECAHAVKGSANPVQAVNSVFEGGFLKSKFMNQDEEKLAGALLLKYEDDITELIVAHTTSTMCFGFANQRSCKASVSRLPHTANPGTAVQIEGIVLK